MQERVKKPLTFQSKDHITLILPQDAPLLTAEAARILLDILKTSAPDASPQRSDDLQEAS